MRYLKQFQMLIGKNNYKWLYLRILNKFKELCMVLIKVKYMYTYSRCV